jgi:hypothetical protein
MTALAGHVRLPMDSVGENDMPGRLIDPVPLNLCPLTSVFPDYFHHLFESRVFTDHTLFMAEVADVYVGNTGYGVLLHGLMAELTLDLEFRCVFVMVEL